MINVCNSEEITCWILSRECRGNKKAPRAHLKAFCIRFTGAHNDWSYECTPNGANIFVKSLKLPGIFWVEPNSDHAVPITLLKPTGYVMHQKFNIQQLYALPALYLCVLYLYQNKQRFVSQHKLTGFITEMKSVYCAVRTGSLNKAVCASSVKG